MTPPDCSFEALVVCPRCGRNGREGDLLVVGRTADPPVGAFVGHYRCLACRRDFIQGLRGDPEKGRELLEEIAAWPERHRPSRRLHRLYLRGVYGAVRGPRLDPLHRVHAELIRERALANPCLLVRGPPRPLAPAHPPGRQKCLIILSKPG